LLSPFACIKAHQHSGCRDASMPRKPTFVQKISHFARGDQET
jgi:hypothetical protein